MMWPSLLARYQDARGAQKKRIHAWHVWFAWHPVRIGRATVWLEFIERKSTGFGRDDYDYRPKWDYRLIGEHK